MKFKLIIIIKICIAKKGNMLFVIEFLTIKRKVINSFIISINKNIYIINKIKLCCNIELNKYS